MGKSFLNKFADSVGKIITPPASVDQYCDLAGFEEGAPVFYGHDGSDCTLIRVDGVRSILSPSDFEHKLGVGLYEAMKGLLKEKGHSLSLSYESSANVDDELSQLVTAQRQNALQKRLAVGALIDESEDVLRRAAKRERVLLALWTHPDAGVKGDVQRERSEQQKQWAQLPPADNAQSPFAGLQALDGPHFGAVRRVLSALQMSDLKGTELGPGEDGRRADLAEVRKAVLFHETPDQWSPFAPLDRRYPGAKAMIDADTSLFFAPPVAQQILSINAVASHNLRTIAIGAREYAVMAFNLFPKNIEHFNTLLAALLPVDRDTIPFRITLHLEHMDGSDFGLRRVLSVFASYGSAVSGNIKRALTALQELHESHADVLVKARLIATTWREPDEPAEVLERRRSLLMRNLTTWGDASVMEAPYNPMRALAETAAGMTMRSVVPPAAIAPLSHINAMLPLHRPARIFERGETLFLTPDGKVMPHEAFSSEQLYWLTLIFATPGSGKSVLLNRLNFEFCAYSAGRRLPFCCVIDVGVSSSGFVYLIRNALPEGQRHEALYVRLQNRREDAVNPFDIGLGRREPLPREMTAIESFLATVLNLEGDRDGHQDIRLKLVQSLISRMVSELYRYKSDLMMKQGAALWQPGIDPILDDAARTYGIALRDGKTKWWRLVDEFMRHGEPRLALRAQRYAAPRLSDLAVILNDPTIKQEYPHDLIQIAQRSLDAALEKFPIFAHPTALDIGDARVISFDLQDVVSRDKSAPAQRNNSLFFMAARNCFVSKIGGHEDEISSMVLPSGADPEGAALHALYVSYWRQRYADIGESKKRLAMDEYSLTGGTEGIREVNKADAREGRKWGLELILVSQLLDDFDGLQGLASTVMILNPDTNEAREKAKALFGFPDAVKEVLEKEVTGPVPGRGANMLVRYTLQEQQRWVLKTNLMGPRLLWALTTRKEDRLVRDELVKRVSFAEALSILAIRFPQATALPTWERVVSSGVGLNIEIPTVIVDQIMGELMQAASKPNPRKSAQ